MLFRSAGGTVASEGVDIHTGPHDLVNDPGYLMDIGAQEARFFRAICSSSLSEFGTVFRAFMVNAGKQQNKYALFY